jgi:hypoxanthine phosphoribosyltransferase
MNAIVSDYLHNALGKSSVKKVIKGMEKLILESGVKFDAIAYSGNSGALIVPTLAYVLNKDVILVRKEADLRNCSSRHRVEGLISSGKKPINYIIVDDFPETGRTIERIHNRIQLSAKNRDSELILKGVFFWNSSYHRDKYFCIKGIEYSAFHHKIRSST